MPYICVIMAKISKSIPISEDLFLDRLRFENPWWISGGINPDIEVMRRRLYFSLFIPLVTDLKINRAVVLMGPRRVGKTVMMQHAVQHLIDAGIRRQKIAFVSIDNPAYLYQGLQEFFDIIRKATGITDTDGWYIFFDEIQYLKNWETHLKVLVDSYPASKFIVSGSSAAALRLKSNESGAGRFTEFMLPPLTFQEYMHLKQLDHLMQPVYREWKGYQTKGYEATNLKEVNQHFIHYINFGGYPEVIFSEQIQSDPYRYIKNDIVDKVLLRDLPSLYGIQDVQELNSFFTYLAYNSGKQDSLNNLSKKSNVEKSLLKKYLDYLEAAFLIRIIHRMDDNAKKFERTTAFKIYLTNPSLRSAIFSPLHAHDDALDAMVETAIFSQWLHRDRMALWYAYWKTGQSEGEVDMIGLDEQLFKPKWIVEIKWTNRYFDSPRELKSLFYFCRKNSLNSALVTTIDKEGTVKLNDVEITFLPSAVYAYIVGANTLEQKSRQI